MGAGVMSKEDYGRVQEWMSAHAHVLRSPSSLHNPGKGASTRQGGLQGRPHEGHNHDSFQEAAGGQRPISSPSPRERSPRDRFGHRGMNRHLDADSPSLHTVSALAALADGSAEEVRSQMPRSERGESGRGGAQGGFAGGRVAREGSWEDGAVSIGPQDEKGSQASEGAGRGDAEAEGGPSDGVRRGGRAPPRARWSEGRFPALYKNQERGAEGHPPGDHAGPPDREHSAERAAERGPRAGPGIGDSSEGGARLSQLLANSNRSPDRLHQSPRCTSLTPA